MTFINTKKFNDHRAVAPVIATVLLVAVAVVGGTLIFGFTQGIFSEQQYNAPSALDLLVFNGYDARDNNDRKYHTGDLDTTTAIGVADTGKGVFQQDDTVFIYMLNAGPNTLNILNVTLAGNQFTLDDGTAKENDVKFIRLWFTDILGNLKGFAITVAELEGGLGRLQRKRDSRQL